MDELERRLRGEHDAMRASVPQSGPDVYGAVRSGARRRRTVRALATASVAVVMAGAAGIGAWGLVDSDRGQEPALPDASAVPAPTPAVTASPDATDPTATPGAGDPRFDDSPDGIAEDALPALAGDRGYLREPSGGDDGWAYPTAHLMEDWIWDAVGDGWALTMGAVTWNIGYIDEPLPPAVLYLVSPEDVRFELFELPERMWASPRVTSWREVEDAATIWWRDVEDGDRGAGSLIDLRTGEVDDLVMAVYGANADDYSFVMSNAVGDELWRAESENGFKYYRWSEGADEDGWVATALVEEAPTADDATQGIDMTGFTVTAGGNRVLLRPIEETQGDQYPDGAPMTLVTYDLDSDRVRWTTIEDIERDAYLSDAAFLHGDEILAWVNYPVDEESRSWGGYGARLELGGVGSVTPVDSEGLWPDYYDEDRPYDLYFGEPAPPGANSEACGC